MNENIFTARAASDAERTGCPTATTLAGRAGCASTLGPERSAIRSRRGDAPGHGYAAVALLATLLAAGYRWTQTRYFVGPNGYTIAIFKGVQQDIGPIKLSSVYEVTSIQLNELSTFERQQVEETITADNLADAREIIRRLGDVSK